MTGIRIVDGLIPIGRGQRQLVLGDRYTGKTAIFLFTLMSLKIVNQLLSPEGFGSKRCWGIFSGVCNNLSKLKGMIREMVNADCKWYSVFIASHASSAYLLSHLLPMIGVKIAEEIMMRGADAAITFDDLSKHSKAYRQMCLLNGNIPSRNCFPADVFNVHSSLLERCCKLRPIAGGGSITAFPIIETINVEKGGPTRLCRV